MDKMTIAALFLSTLTACEPTSVAGLEEADADADADADTDTDVDTDTAADDTGEVDTDTAPIRKVGWRLHDDIESMIYVTWKQTGDAHVHVDYSFEDDVWLSTPSRTTRSGDNQIVLVGIPFGTSDIQWELVIEDTGEVFTGDPAATGELSSSFPMPQLVESDASLWLPEGNYLLSSVAQGTGGWNSGGPYWSFILDRQGRVVWASKTGSKNWTLFAQVAVTGDHLLLDEATYWSNWDDGAGSKVHRTYLDEEIDVIDTPGLHHAFVQLPDGTLAWGSQDHGGREALVEKGLADTDETIIWTCQSDWPGSGDCESNGLFYVEDTDTFLYSFYTNNSIVEVDRATGQSLWWAGDVRNGYAFDPSNAQYAWQHGITYTDAGTLLVSSEYSRGGDHSTVLWEYTVDHDAKALHEVWLYNPDIYAQTNGDAWRLRNGNTLHMIGSAGHLKEITADGQVAWHVDFTPDTNRERLLGRGQLLTDLYDLVKP